MAAFRPPKERINSLAEQVLAELEENARIEVKKPDEVKAAVRKVITENLREEHELDEEVMQTLRSHGQKIYEKDADFQKLFKEGKKILAKKKNFPL